MFKGELLVFKLLFLHFDCLLVSFSMKEINQNEYLQDKKKLENSQQFKQEKPRDKSVHAGEKAPV